MNANSHPVQVAITKDDKMYANSHPYQVVIVGGSGGQEGRVVDTLPEEGETGYIYLVLKEETSEGDIYDEYLWVLQADGETYGWEHIGATNEVTLKLYTTYGQNTDGAMTQKATTDLVYTAGDPKKINIGDNGVVGATNSIIIGSEDSGTIVGASDQIIIGHNITDAGHTDAIAIGHQNNTSNNGVAIGHNISGMGTASVAIGATIVGTSATQAVGVGFGAKPKYDGVAIGYLAENYSSEAVSIGTESRANANGVAIGHSAIATSTDGIAIGYSAGGANNGGGYICIGKGSYASGNAYLSGVRGYGTAIGYQAKTNTYGVSIGYNADSLFGAIYPVTVALGAFSSPRARGVVDVSTGSQLIAYQGENDETYTQYRVISGVHDPELAQDAATKNYVDTKVGDIETILQTINSGTGV